MYLVCPRLIQNTQIIQRAYIWYKPSEFWANWGQCFAWFHVTTYMMFLVKLHKMLFIRTRLIYHCLIPQLHKGTSHRHKSKIQYIGCPNVFLNTFYHIKRLHINIKTVEKMHDTKWGRSGWNIFVNPLCSNESEEYNMTSTKVTEPCDTPVIPGVRPPPLPKCLSPISVPSTVVSPK